MTISYQCFCAGCALNRLTHEAFHIVADALLAGCTLRLHSERWVLMGPVPASFENLSIEQAQGLHVLPPIPAELAETRKALMSAEREREAFRRSSCVLLAPEKDGYSQIELPLHWPATVPHGWGIRASHDIMDLKNPRDFRHVIPAGTRLGGLLQFAGGDLPGQRGTLDVALDQLTKGDWSGKLGWTEWKSATDWSAEG